MNRTNHNADLKRNFYYMYVHDVCHDGISEPGYMSLFDVLYPLFILSGMGIFLWVLLHWNRIKRKIKGEYL